MSVVGLAHKAEVVAPTVGLLSTENWLIVAQIVAIALALTIFRFCIIPPLPRKGDNPFTGPPITTRRNDRGEIILTINLGRVDEASLSRLDAPHEQ